MPHDNSAEGRNTADRHEADRGGVDWEGLARLVEDYDDIIADWEASAAQGLDRRTGSHSPS